MSRTSDARRLIKKRIDWLTAKAGGRAAAGEPVTMFAAEVSAFRLALACIELVIGYGWAGLSNFGYPLLKEQCITEHKTFWLGPPIDDRPPLTAPEAFNTGGRA